MLKKGRKREAKGLAVVYFIIGLIILLIILAVIYFALVELDYSDHIKDPDATIRSYVEMTPDPNAFELEEDDTFAPDGEDAGLDVDLTVPTNTPVPSPTPTPTAEPTPTPTPEPTPTPTPIPPSMLAQPRTAGFKLPPVTTANVSAGITKCSVSVGDDNRAMYLAGYGFLNDANFDGAFVQSFLVVTPSKTNQPIAYQLTMRPGISGDPHAGALCKNATNTDFEICFNVSQYPEDIYMLGLVIGYKANGRGKATFTYYALPSDINFNVLAGQVVQPVKVPGAMEEDFGADVADVAAPDYAIAAEPGMTANGLGADAGAINANAGIDSGFDANTGFDNSEPDDMVAPETPTPAPTVQAGAAAQPGVYNPALAGVTQQPAAADAAQQPAIDNAAQNLQDTTAIQEQIYQNQMGIG